MLMPAAPNHPLPPTVADTIRKLGRVASICLQPFDGHYTGQLWTVSANHEVMGMGETLEMALADLATHKITEGKAP